MKTQNLSLIVCMFGIFLTAFPMVVSLAALPYSPYIPENYYSSGTIDYVNAQIDVIIDAPSSADIYVKFFFYEPGTYDPYWEHAG